MPFERLVFGWICEGPLRAHVILALTRVATGLFFAISGYYKLFSDSGQARMLATMIEAGIALPSTAAWLVAGVELLFGLLLLAGLLSRVSVLLLAAICLVATVTDGIHRIPTGISAWEWLDWLLYLPEVLYLFLLGFILVLGADRFAIDHAVLPRRGPRPPVT
jgi:putative oxidoreductase